MPEKEQGDLPDEAESPRERILRFESNDNVDRGMGSRQHPA